VALVLCCRLKITLILNGVHMRYCGFAHFYLRVGDLSPKTQLNPGESGIIIAFHSPNVFHSFGFSHKIGVGSKSLKNVILQATSQHGSRVARFSFTSGSRLKSYNQNELPICTSQPLAIPKIGDTSKRGFVA
jgi:hypothetical protein